MSSLVPSTSSLHSLLPAPSPPLTLQPLSFQPPPPDQPALQATASNSSLVNMPPLTEQTIRRNEGKFTHAMHELAESLREKMRVKPSIPSSLSAPSSTNSDQSVIIHLMRHAEVISTYSDFLILMLTDERPNITSPTSMGATGQITRIPSSLRAESNSAKRP
jgi:hypothetical protein